MRAVFQAAHEFEKRIRYDPLTVRTFAPVPGYARTGLFSCSSYTPQQQTTTRKGGFNQTLCVAALKTWILKTAVTRNIRLLNRESTH